MTPIVVIGATLAAFQFCTILRIGSGFDCVVLEPGSTPSENLMKAFDSSKNFQLFFDAPLRSSKGHFFNENVVEILKDVSKRVLMKRTDRDFNGTVGDLLLEKLSDNVVHGRDFLNLLSRQQCHQNCDSSLFEVLYKDFPGVVVGSSNSSLDWIKNSVNSDEAYGDFLKTVSYGKQVSHIDYSDNDVIIKCTDGTKYTAPYALFTLSLGVLKRSYKTMFTPPLPRSKINAIQGFCTTSTNEITLEFASALPKAGRSMNFLWLGQDFKSVEVSDKRWLLGIPGLYSHPLHDNQLIGFNTGDYSKQMEALSPDQLKKGFEFLLKKFYLDQAPLRARGVKPQLSLNLPRLVNVKITRVNSDPSTLGGTTFKCASANIFEASYDDLASPAINFKG